MRQAGKRRLLQRARLFGGVGKIDERREAAVDAALHAAAEQKIGIRIGERFFRQFGGGFLWCIRRRRRAAAPHRISRPIDAEDRFPLFQQVDHRIQALFLLGHTADGEGGHDGGD